MTELALRAEQPTSDLSIRSDQTFWDDKQRAALVQLGIDADVSDADLAVFFHHVARTGLDPFARQVYMIGRWSREGTKQTIQTGIDGFRLIARRATDRRNGTFGYESTEWCGRDGVWRDVWLDSAAPSASRVTVIRDGARFPAVALYAEYAGTKRDGSPTAMWASKGALMLAKCAEALALRKAFPQDLSGLYTGDEMQASGDAPTQAEPAPAAERLRSALDKPLVAEAGEAPEPTDASQPGITPAQTKNLHRLANLIGIDRDKKIEGASKVAGRTITSTSDLSKAEAGRVIDALQKKANEMPEAPETTPDEAEVVEAELVYDELNAQAPEQGEVSA